MNYVSLAVFETLRTATEQAIKEARLVSIDFDDPINWADLRCVRVVQWIDDSGDGGITVEIEEASPDASEFHRWIQENIKERTGFNVSVVTEW